MDEISVGKVGIFWFVQWQGRIRHQALYYLEQLAKIQGSAIGTRHY
jgi:hypothetical protein